jgi:hypothetical protein
LGTGGIVGVELGHMPKYFVAVFGEPEPGKNTVESGVYTPHANCAPFKPTPGDVMFLYCTSSYTAHALRVPGIGIVLLVDGRHIEYRWMPLVDPIPRAVMDTTFDRSDAAEMGNIRFYQKWLFEISRQSFSKAIGNRAIAWAHL